VSRDSSEGTTASGPAERTVRDERRLSPMRRTIAERLGESYREAVHVTLHREVRAEALLAVVEGAGADDSDVSLLDPLLLAVSETLAAHPAFNATFDDDTHRLYEEHNVAVAVAIEAGLVTPVLADVGSMSLSTVASERRRVTDLVQSGDYSMSDLRGGTFTVSNLGPLGVDSFTPIINPPQVAILGVGRTRERAIRPAEGSPEAVGFEQRLSLDLVIDHRVVDGADGARFLETLAGHVEDVDSLVEERA